VILCEMPTVDARSLIARAAAEGCMRQCTLYTKREHDWRQHR